MAQTDKPMLDGKVEMDVTYVGGWNRRKGQIGKFDNKEVVVGIRKRNGDLRFFHARDAKGGTLAQYIRENISEDVEVIFTDDASANEAAMRKTKRTASHKKINHGSGVYVIVQGCFTLVINGERIPLRAGEEHFIPRGVPHSGEVLAGTRTIHAFGGHRADRDRLD